MFNMERNIQRYAINITPRITKIELHILTVMGMGRKYKQVMLGVSQQFIYFFFYFEVRHPRCVGSITKNFCVLHVQSNTTIFHPVVPVGIQLRDDSTKLCERGPPPKKKPTSAKTAHPVTTLLCHNILLHQWHLQHF